MIFQKQNVKKIKILFIIYNLNQEASIVLSHKDDEVIDTWYNGLKLSFENKNNVNFFGQRSSIWMKLIRQMISNPYNQYKSL